MYKIRPLFEKYQNELTSFANTSYGRDFISCFGGKELKENYPVVKVAPDGIHQWLGKDKFRAVFYPRSPYVAKFAEVLTMVDIASENYKIEDPKLKHLVIPHFLGETRLLNSKLPQIYLAEDTFNPDADPESTSMDAHVLRAGSGTWTTIRAGAGTFSADSGANVITRVWPRIDISDNFNQLERNILLFDTSSLTTLAEISASIMSLYISAKNNTQGSLAVSMVTSSPASDTSVVNADYGQLQTVKQAGDISYASQTVTAYNDFTLNATGLGNISKTGVSKFGIRLTLDLADSPIPTWSSTNNYSGILANSSDSGSNIPKLVVTYTLPGGARVMHY